MSSDDLSAYKDDPLPEGFKNAENFYTYDPKEHEAQGEILGFDDPSEPPIPGCNQKYIQWKFRRIAEHFITRILTAILIIVDMIVLIVDLSNGVDTVHDDPLEYVAMALSIYFVVEVSIRLMGLGMRRYFRSWLNSMDFFLVMATFVLSIVTLCVESLEATPANLIVALRLVRLLRICRIFWQRRHLQIGARQFISQNKRRFQRDGFDLDLTYVTSRIIAMSFPSIGRMSLYRNPIREVSRFLNTKHTSAYRIYNLCAEREYDISHFHGNVKRFKIDDHNVPSLEELLAYSKDSQEFLDQNPDNVLVVHCKGGKGRTGTMVCVTLIDMGVFKRAESCLGYFGERRTDKNVGKSFQGVETPSQSRYVCYYEKVVRNGRILPESRPLILSSFTIRGISSIGTGTGSEFKISIRCKDKDFYADIGLHLNCKISLNKTSDEIHITLTDAPQVDGDTKVMFLSTSKKIPRGYDNCPFYFWFHTAFIEEKRLELNREVLDNPHKSKTWDVFTENFLVTTHFQDIN